MDMLMEFKPVLNTKDEYRSRALIPDDGSDDPKYIMYQEFVSKSDIDRKKEERKEHFQQKLQKARGEYESAKWKTKLQESRGDSKWMLPSLDNRLDSGKKVKKKKSKKSKHKSKKKKHKHQKSKHSSSDSSENDDDDDSWEEAVQEKTQKDCAESNADADNKLELNEYPKEKLQRQDWMVASSLFDIATSSTSAREHKTRDKKLERKKEEEEERKRIHASRELNPYWKDGGSGVPNEKGLETKSQAQSTKNHVVGDGGRSWIRKAFERAQQQAIEEGVPLEEVVARRWGSMEKLNALLKASERSSASKSHSSGWRKHGNYIATEGSALKKTNLLTNEKQDHEKQDQDWKNEISYKDRDTMLEEETDTKKDRGEESSDGGGGGDDDDDGGGTTSEEEKITVFEPLTEKEKNELNAKILRAELMDDDELAEKFKKRLETGNPIVKTKKKKKGKESQGKNDGDDDEEEGRQVILTRTDKHGNLYPVKLKSATSDLNEKRKRKKKIGKTHDEHGKRIRYFEDDDQVDLKTMVEEERMTSSEDQQMMLARLAGKHLGHAQGEDYTLDDMFVMASATEGTSRHQEKRVKEKAVQDHKTRELQAENCRFCFENPRLAKHLIISIGIKSYLALPINASLTDGHCVIIPMNHVNGQTYFDEDVYQEIRTFKKELTRMFSDQDEDVIFMETCKFLKKQPHAVLECIPIEKHMGDMAPIYFKKAIMESESEWSENKKLTAIKAQDGVAKAIPKGFPYFAVEFGMDGGYAHVIEDEQTFPYYFGKEIIGGMLDLEPRLWRKPPKESFEQHKRKVLKFAERWKPYDWTKKLSSSS